MIANPIQDSLHLLQRAEDFYQAFEQLPEGIPPSWPRYFLLCHSIELALKAYLAWRGVGIQELKNSFKHDIRKLIHKATQDGLPLKAEAIEAIELLDEAHRFHWARYPMQSSKPVYIIDQFHKDARDIIDSIRTSILPTINVLHL